MQISIDSIDLFDRSIYTFPYALSQRHHLCVTVVRIIIGIEDFKIKTIVRNCDCSFSQN